MVDHVIQFVELIGKWPWAAVKSLEMALSL